MRRAFWSQDFDRVRIERNDNSCSVGRRGVTCGRRNNSSVSEMNAVKYSNGKKKRAGQRIQISDGSQGTHGNGYADVRARSRPQAPRIRDTSAKLRIRRVISARSE